MYTLSNSPTRRYLLSNPQNNWLYTAAATKKKALQQNPFAHHQRSVIVFDGISWQVKIELHQFNNIV